ncbi:lipase secretion chaperone [Myxococcus sp. SDU36]|uniref:lipase secretion chaperone n=1 Tax=Myxococcus sp. SDU36 TaxID=2831967 RepID=UPI002542D3D5|nr:lipase secretion chaperone [Myxococcus sp. SDU36]WIG98910.1 lipase chaperone [Myxococcus sp. SDU36]
MKSRAVIPVAALCALLGAGVFSWWKARATPMPPGPAVTAVAPPTASPPRVGVPAPRRAAPTATPAAAASPATALPPMPGSLQDTEEDGSVQVDATGHLVVSPDLRRLFDYYLSAMGEEALPVIRERILASLRAKNLPAAAMDEAVRLLDDYLAYRDAARTFAANQHGAELDLSARLESLRELRREHLGAWADGLFGDEERVDAVSVERMKLQQDTTLTPEERERRISALDEQLPADYRASRDEALRALQQQTVERELVESGATAEDLRQHRLATVGPEATERLEAMDREEAEWERRLAEFRARREALGQSEPNPAARQAAVQRLLFDSFTPEERLRVEALDAIDAASGAP